MPPLVLPQPRMKRWKRTSCETVANYRVFRVQESRYLDGAGTPKRSVFTFACPAWCNVVAVTDAGELVLIWQHRFGTDALSLEIPGGVVDPGESPMDGARRELREETGYEAPSLAPLIDVDPNPALQDNVCHTFLARGAHLVGKTSFDDNEECEVILVPVEHTQALIDQRLVTHALVVVALQAFLRCPPPVTSSQVTST
jgi:ADP-ribose pyrophosphatase